MQETLLQDAGLTQNEIKAYITLLKTGKSQTGHIIKHSKISSGKVYETLTKLIEKGLVEVVIENNVKQFSATNPESLLLLMKERQERVTKQTEKIKEIIPKLQKLQRTQFEPESVYLIKGFRGIKPIVYRPLKHCKDEVKVMGVRSSKDPKFNIFWQHWHNERVRLKVKARLIFTDKDTDYWRFFKNLKHTKVKTVTQVSPSAIMVINRHSFIFTYENSELTCVHSTSPAIAKSFSSFFEGLWDIGTD